MEKSFGFENVSIKQKKNICLSRLDAKIESEIINGIVRPVPLIASNMSTVINAPFYILLYELGAFGILHRADSLQGRINSVESVARNCEFVASSIGIGNDEYEAAKLLITNGCNVINIDIAHGYCDPVIDLGRKLKKEFPHIKMIVGNTVNVDMLDEIVDFADALKVGIAQGFACETKNTAGCTEKQFSCLMNFKTKAKNMGIPIISDGGIREAADVVKAIGAGASSVMMGKIFAACPESAATLVNGKKLYAGMASEHVQTQWKGGLKAGTCSEGGVRLLDVGDSVYKVIEHYSGALRSGISYSGTNNLRDFQDKVEFIQLI